MFRHLISIAVCILVASAASAQMDKNDTPDHLNLLRGLKTIDLVIDGVDDDAQRCGQMRQHGGQNWTPIHKLGSYFRQRSSQTVMPGSRPVGSPSGSSRRCSVLRS
jgi:hypothetical protein